MFVCVVDEGYQRRVTVDDEDSTILVYDSWKQVSQKEFVLVLARWECIIIIIHEVFWK